ncbi:hypothetical protein [Elizabethkingia anophelis]|uniref:hypothetical protein n=1 Tax=Elizabethkingia anophelis TaxID=1117645 RepID=UPI00389167F5
MALLGLTSCRSNDTEGNLTKGGLASVKVSLSGTDYAALTNASDAQASLKSTAGVNNTGIETHGVMLSPSMILEAGLVPSSLSNKTSLQASTKLNTLAAVDGDPLGAGMKFRVIAYRQNDGSYQDYKDYTVGQPADALALDIGTAYNLVAYSYGKTTLPAITAGEITNINGNVLNYNYILNKDFMYQNISYTPGGPESNVNLTLRHKLSLITTTVTSTLGNINSITNAKITPTYLTGTILLSTGK